MNLDQSKLKDLYLRKFIYRLTEQVETQQPTNTQTQKVNFDPNIYKSGNFKNEINLPETELNRLFSHTKKETSGAGRGAGQGRGEYLVGTLLTGITDPKELDEKGVIGGRGSAYDIDDIFTGNKYEVKELAKGSSVYFDKADLYYSIKNVYMSVLNKINDVIGTLDKSSIGVLNDLLKEKDFFGTDVNISEYLKAVYYRFEIKGSVSKGILGLMPLKRKGAMKTEAFLSKVNIPDFILGLAKFAETFKDVNFKSSKVKKLAKTFKELYGQDKEINDEWFGKQAEEADTAINKELCNLGSGNCTDIENVINKLVNMNLSSIPEQLKNNVSDTINSWILDQGLKGVFIVKNDLTYIYIPSDKLTDYLILADLPKNGVVLEFI